MFKNSFLLVLFLVLSYTLSNAQSAQDDVQEVCEIVEAFTPNDDGFNDVFDLSCKNVSKLEIYNRYGKLVYQKKDYTNQWKGNDTNNTILSSGTYFYLAYKKDNSKLTGYVYLTR